MNRQQKLKITVDIFMTTALLFLMPYGMVGETAHECIGTGMFLLFILHHFLNRKWTAHMGTGSYTPFRIVQTVLAVLILIFTLGSAVSGIILSRHVFSFLDIRGLSSLARNVHMICAYWGFVLMSVHLGLHWGMMIKMAEKAAGKPSESGEWIFRLAGFFIAGYGLYAFIKRDILSYMLMQVHFVFFDYTESVIFFILDYMAAMGFFVFIGYYLHKILIKISNKRKSRKE